MEKLLTKKEAYFMVGCNPNLKGSAAQKEEKTFNLLCNAEKTGTGRGTRFRIIELYETPKNTIHGNFGRAPVNKGAVSTVSLKFTLAKALSQVGEKNCYLSRTKYLNLLGLNSENLKHIERYLGTQKFHELNTVDKLVFTEVQNMQLALNRLWNEAIELLSDGKVKGVKLHERLFVAHHETSHDEADDVFKKPKELQSLYKIANEEARETVKQKYGKNIFFTTRMKLIRKEYLNLRILKNKYVPLNANQVEYFYNKYAIESTYKNNGKDFTVEFFQKFVSHRKKLGHQNLNKHLRVVTGDFLNNTILSGIVERLFILMFENDSYIVFKSKFTDMIKEAKDANTTEVKRVVNNGLFDLFPNKNN